MVRLTEDFLSYFCFGLQEDYAEMIQGKKKEHSEIFLGLTRNNPVMITCDKNPMPNGAVKS